MSIASGASTYAVAQVAIENFAAGRDLFDIDLKAARNAYRGAYEDGKEYAVKLNDEKGTARDVFEKLEKLGKLKDEGLITEEEFQEQEERLLERL